MSPRRRSGKKIDFLHWTFAAGFIPALSAGTLAASIIPAQHLPETLMRTRGEICVGIDGAPVAGRSAIIGVGLILVPEGTGTTVLWSPISDGDAPWFWVDYFFISYEEMVTDVIITQELAAARRVVDSKAMRIVKNMEFQLVAENTTLAGAVGVNVNFVGRVLAGT